MRDSTSTKSYDVGDVVMAGVIIAVLVILSLYIISFIYDLSVFDFLFLTLRIPLWVVLSFIAAVISLIVFIFSRQKKEEHNITGIGKGYYFGVNWEWSYLYYENRYIPYMFKPICPKCQCEMSKVTSLDGGDLQFKCSSCDGINSNVIHLNRNDLDDFMGTIVSSSDKKEAR
ncbi:zf-TFIIB domain-containing protein [Photobacterium damselae subsp. damselae]|uniref:zf-TFIIB domain-containing protein n=1 Tax=Photobacterium damselae TaxID=38293 RepID=UPI00109BD913|nr:zf-TFIIB domain-containing protein [Photobacterium damselae]TGZ34012.1 hypothetical protein EQ875_02578 [Photobacterium damselae subsp. damselae]